MAGNKIGGVKAVDTIRRRHGERFYAQIGRIGGSRGHTGGFYANRELASAAGRIGGMVSRKGGRHGSTRLTPRQRANLKRKKAFQQAYDRLLKVRAEAEKKRIENKHLSYVEY